MKKLPLAEIAHHAGKLGFRWVAVDYNKNVFGYVVEPIIWGSVWGSIDDECSLLHVHCSDCTGWKQSLTKCEVEK
jgi:hypothetical protein